MVPRNDVARGVHARALVDHERVAIVFPGHFILARELYANGFPDGLRQQRSIVGHGVRAVDAVTTRGHAENDVDVLRA